ncbi:MAG: TRAP transporter substrate-binding protein [Burkholderiales bacterium]|nr:TRAP transporter substrate-binding protein [Burkholderiales bacterium]
MCNLVIRPVWAACALALLTGAAAAQTELKLATFGPPTSYFYVDTVLPWAEAVSKDSGGTITIKHYGGGVLGHAGNMYDTVLNGAADIAWALQGTVPNKFVKSSVVELPFAYDAAEPGAVALWRVVASGLAASDYDQVKLLAVTTWPGGSLASREKQMGKLEDFKGMKIAVSGRLRADVVTALGGVPVNIPVDQIYQAIGKGVVDGFLGSITAMRQFKYNEVSRHWLKLEVVGAGAMLIMNKTRFDGLPARAKEAIEKHSGEALSRALGKSNDAEEKRAWAFLDQQIKQGRNAPIQPLPPAEVTRWQKAVQPVIDSWAQRTPNGKAVYEGYLAAVKSAKSGK